MKLTEPKPDSFNRLEITNLEEYLSGYTNIFDRYLPPFHILANLEREVKYKEIPEQTLSFPYAPQGLIFFELVGIRSDQPRVILYRYDKLTEK
ncbi:MAG TPA: hypothetical protein VK787_12365 [Puia sp.]|jgi:hypothetical protein|nr:hypothetical protein [Puia sp.]